MLFEEISPAFWRRTVFIDCDVNTLLSLIQTSKFMYKQRKYLYRICFIILLKSFSSHELYYCNIEKIHSIYKMNLDLFVRNKVLQSWYLKYNLKQETLICLIRKLFITHNMMDLSTYLKNKTEFIALVKRILNQYINYVQCKFTKKPYRYIYLNGGIAYKYTYNNESYIIPLRE